MSQIIAIEMLHATARYHADGRPVDPYKDHQRLPVKRKTSSFQSVLARFTRTILGDFANLYLDRQKALRPASETWDNEQSLALAEHLNNDHAIRSGKRPAPMRRPRGGRAQARIAVSEKIQNWIKIIVFCYIISLTPLYQRKLTLLHHRFAIAEILTKSAFSHYLSCPNTYRKRPLQKNNWLFWGFSGSPAVF